MLRTVICRRAQAAVNARWQARPSSTPLVRAFRNLSLRSALSPQLTASSCLKRSTGIPSWSGPGVAGTLIHLRCESTWGRSKVASKRKTKKHKLKNHGGAVARWMVSGDGVFKRAQAGRRHLNRKMRVWKRKSKKRRVLATTTQKKSLKKLIPYWKKHYLR